MNIKIRAIMNNRSLLLFGIFSLVVVAITNYQWYKYNTATEGELEAMKSLAIEYGYGQFNPKSGEFELIKPKMSPDHLAHANLIDPLFIPAIDLSTPKRKK